VDRPDPGAVASLFTSGGRLVVAADPTSPDSVVIRRGPAEIEKAMSSLRRYVATSHIVGAHRGEIEGNSARGETTCVAYQLSDEPGEPKMMVLGIRYVDTYERTVDGWRFDERQVRVKWRDERIWNRSDVP
ncbi:MAG TPA: nuclear transport factor 2 family protein, partial [Acidimicrobiales bacterium]|nr:nuclear transport factor 2 family protein [Acidimicrobiales bacterium]